MVDNPYDTYDYSIEFACRQRGTELQKGVDRWLAHGGSLGHFKFVYAEEARLRELIERGPIGFGPCPEGCMVTDDRSLIKNGMLAYSEGMARTTENFSKWFVGYKIANDMQKFPSFGWLSDFNLLWMLNAKKEDRKHPWWAMVYDADLLNRLTIVVIYLFLRGLGFPRMQIMESIQGAFENGYLPVSWEGERPVVLCVPEKTVNRMRSLAGKKKR